MDLILWRHAEAENESGAGGDLERRLTAKGERQAERMADWLNRRLPASTRILASPARRTQQTAKALDRRFKTVPALAPGAGVDEVLAAARWPDANEPVLVVGHQPVLGRVVARLLAGPATDGSDRDWTIRKGAVVWLRQRDRDREDGDDDSQVVLQAVQGPDLL
jgi:phosphohistidine phosphatase